MRYDKPEETVLDNILSGYSISAVHVPSSGQTIIYASNYVFRVTVEVEGSDHNVAFYQSATISESGYTVKVGPRGYATQLTPSDMDDLKEISLFLYDIDSKHEIRDIFHANAIITNEIHDRFPTLRVLKIYQ